MAYSEEALAFSTIPTKDQVRLEDRVSYLYLEYCQVRQDRTGVIARQRGDYPSDSPKRIRIQLPVAGLGVLMLGPGTSISQPAATSCARAGTAILYCGGGGVPAYSLATPLTSSARWAIAQARLVANEAHQRKAAVILYRKQLGIEVMPTNASIATMRGLEGRLMRQTYKQVAARYKVKDFKRNTESPDPINQSLNLANSILYGCAAAVCSAIGVNPALGIIHRGDIRSLLFDLADMYKPDISIPLAFKHARSDNYATLVRSDLRKLIVKNKILEEMLQILMTILTPYLPARNDDRLIGGRNREVAGHTQYA